MEAPVFLGLPERGFVHDVSRVLQTLTSALDKCVYGLLLLVFSSCLVFESNHIVFVEMKRGKPTQSAVECEIFMIS